MFAKGTKLYSIIHNKCPRCQDGAFFTHSPLSLKFAQTNKVCPVCGLDFYPEPAYYIGAMYVSYAIQVAVIVGVYLVLNVTTDPSLWTYGIWVTVATLAIIPWNFRLSRLVWINLFYRYKGGA
jgi:uncharacterized protein (DUF983 family)